MPDDEPPDWRLHAFRPDLADVRLKWRVDAARYVDGAAATVALPSAPLLRRPEAGAPMDSQLLLGESVRVFERRDGWAWVQADADGYVGYVAEPAIASGLPPVTHKVITGQTVVLSDEKQIAAPLHTLSIGAKVSVTDEGERFHRLAGGGFIFAAHLAPIDQIEEDWVAVAERLLHLPYLWGGRGHGGIDCSGLVQVALAACGHTVLRDSDQQARTIGRALPLDPGAWQRGDLLYMKGHVLIAYDADWVLHATGFRWAVMLEKMDTALSRLTARGQPVTSARRPGPHRV